MVESLETTFQKQKKEIPRAVESKSHQGHANMVNSASMAAQSSDGDGYRCHGYPVGYCV